MTPSKASYASIIQAEVVYTLSELGVEEVHFPGYAERPLRRSDIPYAVFTLQVPIVRAVPLEELGPSQVLLPDGTTLSHGAFAKRWKAGDAELQKAFLSSLTSSDYWAVQEALARLPKAKLNGWTKAVLPVLQHKNPELRKQALEALEAERDEANVLDAVVVMLDKEKDEAVAQAAATFLGGVQDKKYSVQRQFFLLGRGEEKESVAAVSELAKSFGTSGDPRVGERLREALKDKRAAVAEAAVAALEAMDADDAQIAALSDKAVPEPRRLAVARDLAEDSDAASKVAGLSYLGREGSERQAAAAIEALAVVPGDAARSAAEGFLADPRAARQLAAARGLAARKDATALAALARAATKAEGEVAYQIEDAGYQVMVAQPLKGIQEQTGSRDSMIKRLAYRALGERAVKENAGRRVFSTLQEGARSSDALIRGAAARALGAFASPESLAVLKGLSKDKSAEVRRDVALALANYKGGEMSDELTGYLDDRAPEVQAAAIEAMRQRSEAHSWDKIKELALGGDAAVKAAALGALASLVDRGDAATTRQVVDLLSRSLQDASLDVQAASLRALGTFTKTESATTAIATKLSDPKEPVRVAAVLALGEMGGADAPQLVAGKLTDESAEVRRAAVLALVELKARGQKGALQEQLRQEKNAEVKALIEQTLKKL